MIEMVSPRPARPVLWFGAIGALLVLLNFWILGMWILSDDFKAAPKGADAIPDGILHGVYRMQALSIAFAILAIILFWRSSRREGKLSLAAIIGIAWFLSLWQDPLADYLRPAFFYNAYLWNMGSWSPQIPGWSSPYAGRLPEPLLYTGVMYIYIFPAFAFAIDRLLRWVRSRKPGIGVIGQILIAVVVCMVSDFLLETTFMRSKLYAWPGIPSSLAVFAGTPFQFPAYETMMWGPVWASTACLYAFRDSKGFTWLDRGLDRVGATRWHSLLRVLAMVAFANVFFILYNIGMNLFELRSSPMPQGYESWLKDGLCGSDPASKCIGPDVPIYTITAPPPAPAAGVP